MSRLNKNGLGYAEWLDAAHLLANPKHHAAWMTGEDPTEHRDHRIWLSADGPMYISVMNNDHLRNTLRYIERKRSDGREISDHAKEQEPRLHEEWVKRGFRFGSWREPEATAFNKIESDEDKMPKAVLLETQRLAKAHEKVWWSQEWSDSDGDDHLEINYLRSKLISDMRDKNTIGPVRRLIGPATWSKDKIEEEYWSRGDDSEDEDDDLAEPEEEDGKMVTKIESPLMQKSKDQASRLGAALATGGSMAALDRAGTKLLDFGAKSLFKGIPGMKAILATEVGREGVKAAVAVVIHSLATHTDLLPKRELLTKAMELQLTTSAYKLLGPVMGDLMDLVASIDLQAMQPPQLEAETQEALDQFEPAIRSVGAVARKR